MLVYFTILAIATVLAVFLVLPALTICSLASYALDFLWDEKKSWETYFPLAR